MIEEKGKYFLSRLVCDEGQARDENLLEKRKQKKKAVGHIRKTTKKYLNGQPRFIDKNLFRGPPFFFLAGGLKEANSRSCF